ncbi:MAG: putative acetyltransferase protein [Capsulimonas sp.]|jgi:GNAT superfamily N-acetyltransferase|nr:putative acetyltransferase protein [Capsulimonas sp.]
MTIPPQITLRPETPEDEPFLYDVYASTRQQELMATGWDAEQKAQFLRMQFQAQHSFYQSQFPSAQYNVLLQDGDPIGRLYVDRRETELRILDIALLPPFCNQGLGTQLIQELMLEAAGQGVPLSLHVETFNRARTLYGRLGFTEVQNDGLYILMEWTARRE